MKIGFIVGRFQAPTMHDGYLYLIKQTLAVSDKFAIVLSETSIGPTIRNFLVYDERVAFIKLELVKAGLLQKFAGFIFVKDQSRDGIWSINLDSAIRNFIFEIEHKLEISNIGYAIFGSRDSFLPFYSGNILTVSVNELTGCKSSTEVRQSIIDNAKQYYGHPAYAAGKLKALSQQFPKVYPTVDIAILNEDHTEVLLGRKPNEISWRFPGGFTDPTDESYEYAAQREAIEECGKIELGRFEYITSMRINDWRYRNERDKIITNFFLTTFLWGHPEAGDDLEEIKWFPIKDFDTTIMTDAHEVLFKKLVEYLEKHK